MGYMEVYKSWCDNMYFDEATRDELPYNPYSVPLSLLFNNVGENGIFP